MNRLSCAVFSSLFLLSVGCSSGKSGSSGATSGTMAGSTSASATSASSSGVNGSGSGSSGSHVASTASTSGSVTGASSSGTPASIASSSGAVASTTSGASSTSTSSSSGTPYTNVTSGDGGLDIHAVAVTSSTNVVAVGSNAEVGLGFILTSSNLGATWTDVTPPFVDAGPNAYYGYPAWSYVVASSDGTKLLAGASAGDLWTSTNSGATWTDNNVFGDGGSAAGWAGVASDSTGTKLAAAAAQVGSAQTGVFASANGGSTWTDVTPAFDAGGATAGWITIASDSTGQKLATVDLIQGSTTSENLWTSSNGGQSWTMQANPTGTTINGTFLWYSICSDASGNNLLASASDSGIYLSTNGGQSWTQPTVAVPQGGPIAAEEYGNCAETPDGTHMMIGGLGGVFTSSDSGATWTYHTEFDSNFLPMAVGQNSTGTVGVVAGEEDAANSGPFEFWTF